MLLKGKTPRKRQAFREHIKFTYARSMHPIRSLVYEQPPFTTYLLTFENALEFAISQKVKYNTI